MQIQILDQTKTMWKIISLRADKQPTYALRTVFSRREFCVSSINFKCGMTRIVCVCVFCCRCPKSYASLRERPSQYPDPFVAIHRVEMAAFQAATDWASVVVVDAVSAFSSFSTMASHGNRFCSSMLKIDLITFWMWTNYGICATVCACANQRQPYRYFGWLIAYTYGSMQATALHAQAGIIVTAGVNSARLPNEPINDKTAYGVQANGNVRSNHISTSSTHTQRIVNIW